MPGVMSIQPLVCRWGIIGTGSRAVRFVQDIRAAATQSKGSAVPILHKITVIADPQYPSSITAFIEDNYPSTSSSSEASPAQLTTTAEVLSSTIVDAVLIDLPPAEQVQGAQAALRSGKAVLLVRPLTIAAEQARSLVDVARNKKVWLGVLVKESKKAKASLRWIADECARCRERGLPESSQISWEDNIAILEILDDLRSSGALTDGGSAGHPADSAHIQAIQTSTPSARTSTQDAIFPPHIATNGVADIDLTPCALSQSAHPPRSQLDGVRDKIAQAPSEPGQPVIDPSEFHLSVNSSEAARCDGEQDAQGALHSQTEVRATDEDGSSVHAGSDASLRAQVQHLKHLLLQKNAHIEALDGNVLSQNGNLALTAGGNSGRASVRVSMPPRAYSDKPYTGGLPPPTRPVRTRTSSVASVASTSANGAAVLTSSDNVTVRRRKEGAMEPLLQTENRRPSSRASRSHATSGADGASKALSAGFLAPTVASERRRLASLSDQVNMIVRRAVSGEGGSAPSSDAGEKSSGHANNIILQLNGELQYTRGQLESLKTQFSISQRNLASLQKSYDSAKDSLHKARVEAERAVTALAKKERESVEAQERARKADNESKELGRSSRALGTRVRQVESELGDVRRAQAQAEAGYEAIASAWKKTRQKWEEEVKELRAQLQEVVKEHKDQAREALGKLEAVEEEWKGREGQKKGLEAVLEGLKVERERARSQVAGVVEDLVDRLATHEQERIGQDQKVEEVQGELQRLLRFMREGITDAERIRSQILV